MILLTDPERQRLASLASRDERELSPNERQRLASLLRLWERELDSITTVGGYPYADPDDLPDTVGGIQSDASY